MSEGLTEDDILIARSGAWDECYDILDGINSEMIEVGMKDLTNLIEGEKWEMAAIATSTLSNILAQMGCLQNLKTGVDVACEDLEIGG